MSGTRTNLTIKFKCLDLVTYLGFKSMHLLSKDNGNHTQSQERDFSMHFKLGKGMKPACHKQKSEDGFIVRSWKETFKCWNRTLSKTFNYICHFITYGLLPEEYLQSHEWQVSLSLKHWNEISK